MEGLNGWFAYHIVMIAHQHMCYVELLQIAETAQAADKEPCSWHN